METIKKLTELGADTDLIDNNGQTPLFYTIKHGRVEVAQFLL